MNNNLLIQNQFRALSQFSELENIRNFVVSNALSAGLNNEEAQNMALAVDEACTNLINYSFNKESDREIRLLATSKENLIEIEIFDNGPSFNPLDLPEVNLNEYFAEMKKGGLGIKIIKTLIDEIVYIPAGKESNDNTLKLIKYLTPVQ